MWFPLLDVVERKRMAEEKVTLYVMKIPLVALAVGITLGQQLCAVFAYHDSVVSMSSDYDVSPIGITTYHFRPRDPYLNGVLWFRDVSDDDELLLMLKYTLRKIEIKGEQRFHAWDEARLPDGLRWSERLQL